MTQVSSFATSLFFEIRVWYSQLEYFIRDLSLSLVTRVCYSEVKSVISKSRLLFVTRVDYLYSSQLFVT